MRRSWAIIPLFYLALTALSGVVMRWMGIYPIQTLNYGHLLHAHSHLAILGWGFVALFLFFVYYFFRPEDRYSRSITWLFWITQLTVIGMFISFSYQGYGIVSIIFSTIHILLSYWFIILIVMYFRKRSLLTGELQIPALYGLGAVVCLFLSSFGPWMLAYLSANKLTHLPFFDMAVYFYLHFQYNGWFTLGLIAIIFAFLEKQQINYPKGLAKIQFIFFIISILPAYLLSVLWYDLNFIWHVVAIVAGVVHWVSMIIFFYILFIIRRSILLIFKGWSKVFLGLSLFSLFIKITMELGSAIPVLTSLIYDTRSVIIGYLHLTLLGFVSFLCLALYMRSSWLRSRNVIGTIGYTLFIIGFIMNELYLFLQSLLVWLNTATLPFYEWTLLISSLMMFLGIVIFISANNQRHITKTN
ncbi:hypothetical protein ACJ2A9_11795 [Anaerobacillus sp. MEB173]|uniref:hypothetical protein n=1 Tax=Anaerobacillus sp. MEB173 TaxID=3383345 RepID=UPI003F8F0701